MRDLKWSESEKKIARRVFEAALQRELASILARFKELAANASTPEQMWAVRDYLTMQQREIDSKYDYKYSQLIVVFGRLLRENRIEERELSGIAEDKLDLIMRIATL